MIRCIAVDDEPLALNLVKKYIAQREDLELVLASSDVYEALKLAQSGGADLVFLDIQMPELTGLQFMKILNGGAQIILTTAYEEYALQAFEHDVVDYLLKPFSPDRFNKAVDRAKLRAGNTEASTKETPKSGENQNPEFIFVKSEYKIIKISLSDILYLESLRDYVAIHTKKEKIMTLQSMKSFEESLPSANFIRIHKSYLIALDKIGHVERKRVVINDQYLPVGDTYWENFRSRLPA